MQPKVVILAPGLTDELIAEIGSSAERLLNQHFPGWGDGRAAEIDPNRRDWHVFSHTQMDGLRVKRNLTLEEALAAEKDFGGVGGFSTTVGQSRIEILGPEGWTYQAHGITVGG